MDYKLLFEKLVRGVFDEAVGDDLFTIHEEDFTEEEWRIICEASEL